jgi:hypothetical protein
LLPKQTKTSSQVLRLRNPHGLCLKPKMITLRRAMDGRHVQRGKHDIWLAF